MAFCQDALRDLEALQLLAAYVNMLQSERVLNTPELLPLVVAHACDLVVLPLGATRDAAEVARGRGLRVARLHAIKADVRANLHQRDLTTAAVAGRLRITPRYIQELFEAEGMTFSKFVREQRLALARRTLADPRYAGVAISAIAFDVGFGDLSTFNHAFRHRFGATPSDLRHGAA